jgi:hypothetical protein
MQLAGLFVKHPAICGVVAEAGGRDRPTPPDRVSFIQEVGADDPFYWKLNHGVAETGDDMRALIMGAGAVSTEPPTMLVRARQASFLRWCLREGLRVLKPMTLMTMSMYQEPKRCYFPSVLY